MDGNVQIYKARLVVKSYKQIQGVNFDKTFLLIAMLKSKKNFISIIVYYNYEIWEINVKTIFLNRNLHEEDVYMRMDTSKGCYHQWGEKTDIPDFFYFFH